MIKYSPTTAIIRIFPEEGDYEDRAEYEAVVSVMWLNDTKVSLIGAHGKFSRKNMLGVLKAVYDAGAEVVHCTRTNGHYMPWGVKGDVVTGHINETNWTVDLVQLHNRGLI